MTQATSAPAFDRRRYHRQSRHRIFRCHQHRREIRQLQRHGMVDHDRSNPTSTSARSPSLAFDIDGNAYLGYYQRSGGDLRLATLDRDAGTWTPHTVDGADGTDVGAIVEPRCRRSRRCAPASDSRSTTPPSPIAYADSTNGDLKYARLDLDDPTRHLVQRHRRQRQRRRQHRPESARRPAEPGHCRRRSRTRISPRQT